jgi:exopolysaccharide biosynthesis polyprenyl glycosylphosphotransferase
MSTLDSGTDRVDELLRLADPRTLEIVRSRRTGDRLRRRGWLVRRMLICADLLGLVAAFAATMAVLIYPTPLQQRHWLALVAILPVWVVMAKIYGLYDRDEERADHSTVDDFVGVFHLMTVGAWLLLIGGRATGAAEMTLTTVAGFWGLGMIAVTSARAVARATARRSVLYQQNMVIAGAGEIGQLIARKVLQHPEYGINVVGFIDDEPLALRPELAHVAFLGSAHRLPEIVETFDVDRVVIAFSRESELERVATIRALRDLDVQIDVVPRLFDIVGPKFTNHAIEALPLVGLPPVRPTPSSRWLKRAIDVLVASVALVALAPVFLVIALLVRRDSEGPIFFRQTRLGLGMREFTALKFRTMRVDVDDSLHREYIRQTMSAAAVAGDNGIYKLDRGDAVTRTGRWLRSTSLDELPQLLNVLRGDMSLVGPRPCIPYETENFRSHHFERFLVPAGITGLWQVTARAHATFGESLDMDVTYARGWSLGLDLRLLCQTPFHLRSKGTA